MNCPSCGQDSTMHWTEDCPLCGFPMGEVAAVYGMLAYFLTGDAAKFVILLGASWVLFIWLSTQIVSYVAEIQREAVEEWRAGDRR